LDNGYVFVDFVDGRVIADCQPYDQFWVLVGLEQILL
jgi:hypothetical protein